jgi:hypothetical protein
MNKILMSAAVIFCLFNITMVDASKAPEKKEQTEKTIEKSERDEKKSAKKAERAHKVFEACEEALKKAEEHGKLLTGIDKKIFDLFIAHAKLERDAAKDPEMVDHMMRHARYCKRYVGDATKLGKQDDKTADYPEKIKPEKIKKEQKE